MKWLVVLALLAAGCNAPLQPPFSDKYPTICLSKDFEPYIGNWQKQVQERYPQGAYILLVHGNNYHGIWRLYPDNVRSPDDLIMASEAIKLLHAIAKDKPLVVISCNPGHWHIFTPNVMYPEDLVFLDPDCIASFIKIDALWYPCLSNLSQFKHTPTTNESK